MPVPDDPFAGDLRAMGGRRRAGQGAPDAQAGGACVLYGHAVVQLAAESPNASGILAVHAEIEVGFIQDVELVLTVAATPAWP